MSRTTVAGVLRAFTAGVALLVMGNWAAAPRAAELEKAFVFTAHQNADCAVANDPSVNYTPVLHNANNQTVVDSLRYDAARGWGYEAVWSADPADPNFTPYANAAGTAPRNAFAIFGPFDESPNNRNQFPDTCPDQAFDSFIGAKNFLVDCDPGVVGNPDDACADAGIQPEGIIFRVDVPNGKYRFVAVVGSPDNSHTSRIVAEDGGSGPPEEIGPDHVVLVHNHDQAALGGGGFFARVGFGCFLPPRIEGPTFFNMDENGLPTDPGLDALPGTADDGPANSPTLDVTQGYVRIHQLKGNASGDRNGGDMVMLELWKVEEGEDPGNGIFVDLKRTFTPPDRAPGEEVTVELDVTGVVDQTTIVETVPDGWTIEDAGGGVVNGNEITFSVDNDDLITYVVTSAFDCLPAAFTAQVQPTGGCSTSVSSSMRCVPPECGLQFNGAISELNVIGPIDLGGAGGGCDDNGEFDIKDYLDDGGDVSEATVLAAVGDDIAPDFGGAAGGLGVGFAANPFVNPRAFEGTLTVWRAKADFDGRIDYEDPANVGPLDDYIIFGLLYLENTTAECIDAVLEVGSDDSVKVRVNGALVHANHACRGVPATGVGDMVPVTLVPGVNVVLVATVERGGGSGVRLIVRNPDGTPLADGRVQASCDPPDTYPSGVVSSLRSASQPSGKPGDTITVTVDLSGVEGPTTLTEALPEGVVIEDAGGATVEGTTLTFSVDADGPVSYTISLPEGDCPFTSGTIDGTVQAEGGCALAVGGISGIGCVAPPCPPNPEAPAMELTHAFLFGSRDLGCPTFNDPAVNYTTVFQTDALSVEYDPLRGWGYEVIYDPIDNPSPYGDRNGYGVYGPFDNSANNRNKYPDICPEEIYDSFIGGKDFVDTCSAVEIGNPDDPCSTLQAPEGLIFRIDVEPGQYRFVAAYGDADNVHAHRILAQAGGEGGPDLLDEVADNFVVLVQNYDQAQQTVGEVTPAEPGEGVYARVGFDDKIPPPGDGVAPSPQFVNMDAEGFATDPGADGILGTGDDGCPDSPILEVTEDEPWIRIHQLQGNSNDGPGGPRDPNGGDAVVLELWRMAGGGGGPKFSRGDADASGAINITDGIFVLNFLFLGGPDPSCKDAADADDSGAINITDGIYILNFLFLGGPGPKDPSDCGEDPTDDPLDCGGFGACP